MSQVEPEENRKKPPLPPSQLDADRVLKTVKQLCLRIEERFPNAGLLKVAEELETVCARSKERLEWIRQPIWSLRILRYALLALIILGLAISLLGMRTGIDEEPLTLVEFIQLLEAGINDVVLISIAIFFVWGFENRVKRQRAMRALHELRSIAHVIDMHQLTKDPDRLLTTRINTEHSPPAQLDAFNLRRYLDYCSELLSLASKVAALHLQTLDDPTVVATVNEIEDLTTGLSRKIWQKIDMVREME